MKNKQLVIPRNPSQAPASLFRLTRTLKVRGDAIYIIFGGIAGSVFIFFTGMDKSLVLTLCICWVPLAMSLYFYFRFIRGKPKYYFDYTLNGMYGRRLIAPPPRRIPVRERAAAQKKNSGRDSDHAETA